MIHGYEVDEFLLNHHIDLDEEQNKKLWIFLNAITP